MAFTEHEKTRVRHHTGYLNVGQSATFMLGLPAAIETQFMIERAFDLVLPQAEDTARQLIAVLDRIEGQMVDDLELLAVEAVDEIKIRRDEHNALRKEYIYWRNALCNVFGVAPNPFDKRFSGPSAGGINVPVIN